LNKRPQADDRIARRPPVTSGIRMTGEADEQTRTAARSPGARVIASSGVGYIDRSHTGRKHRGIRHSHRVRRPSSARNRRTDCCLDTAQARVCPREPRPRARPSSATFSWGSPVWLVDDRCGSIPYYWRTPTPCRHITARPAIACAKLSSSEQSCWKKPGTDAHATAPRRPTKAAPRVRDRHGKWSPSRLFCAKSGRAQQLPSSGTSLDGLDLSPDRVGRSRIGIVDIRTVWR